LKQERDQALQLLKQAIDQADAQIQNLKQRRKAISQSLQKQLNAAYRLTNFTGLSLTLEQIVLGTAPTGTGDCCAPKLLHYAATHGLKPLAMAEFWWGAANLDKLQGEFYPACTERCQPLLGFLLSGLATGSASGLALEILYEDTALIAVNKPAGLLSVPGRRLADQDSVLSRLQQQYETVLAVHRLDQATSGILLCAKDLPTYRQVSQQFAQRQVQKSYEAVLAGRLAGWQIGASGVVDLPLWGDPSQRPRQVVDWQRGKPSQTEFRVLSSGETPRVEFLPFTGRSHQIRVHAADSQGLATPILGDSLYGQPGQQSDRLYLHAKALRFSHPQTGQIVQLQSEPPF
jgi:tRNA pseudouridine32 synthase/23S rRNA pseudouridine746 synthase